MRKINQRRVVLVEFIVLQICPCTNETIWWNRFRVHWLRLSHSWKLRRSSARSLCLHYIVKLPLAALPGLTYLSSLSMSSSKFFSCVWRKKCETTSVGFCFRVRTKNKCSRRFMPLIRDYPSSTGGKMPLRRNLDEQPGWFLQRADSVCLCLSFGSC